MMVVLWFEKVSSTLLNLPLGFVESAQYPHGALSKLPSLIEKQQKAVERIESEIPTLQKIVCRQWSKTDELSRLKQEGWSSDSIDLDDWMTIYCEARYGGYPDAMEEAWKLFRKTAYSSLYSYPRFTWQTVIPDQRRISKIDLSDDYLQAIRLYASCADELKSSELYRNDLIEFVSYYVAAKAENFYKQALKDDSENRVRSTFSARVALVVAAV